MKTRLSALAGRRSLGPSPTELGVSLKTFQLPVYSDKANTPSFPSRPLEQSRGPFFSNTTKRLFSYRPIICEVIDSFDQESRLCRWTNWDYAYQVNHSGQTRIIEVPLWKPREVNLCKGKSWKTESAYKTDLLHYDFDRSMELDEVIELIRARGHKYFYIYPSATSNHWHVFVKIKTFYDKGFYRYIALQEFKTVNSDPMSAEPTKTVALPGSRRGDKGWVETQGYPAYREEGECTDLINWAQQMNLLPEDIDLTPEDPYRHHGSELRNYKKTDDWEVKYSEFSTDEKAEHTLDLYREADYSLEAADLILKPYMKDLRKRSFGAYKKANKYYEGLRLGFGLAVALWKKYTFKRRHMNFSFNMFKEFLVYHLGPIHNSTVSWLRQQIMGFIAIKVRLKSKGRCEEFSYKNNLMARTISLLKRLSSPISSPYSSLLKTLNLQEQPQRLNNTPQPVDNSVDNQEIKVYHVFKE